MHKRLYISILFKTKYYMCIHIYIILCIYFQLCCVFTAAEAFLLQLWRAGATLWLGCPGFSLQWLLFLEHRLRVMWAQQLGLPASKSTGPIVVAQRPRGMQDQRPNPCLLHWQANSLPLSPQGSPKVFLKGILRHKILEYYLTSYN